MLADYGCGMTAHLVLNGAFRGQVWLHDPNTACFVPFSETATLHYVEAPAVAEADQNVNFSFASWYEHWIDHAILQATSEYESDPV
jgi:hypothetical protein